MKRPAFQFYVTDFISGTMYMTAEEVGGYIRLLCHQWDKGFIPNDEGHIIKVSGCRKRAVAQIIDKFELGDDGNYRNRKLENVRTIQEEFIRKQKENGLKGGRPKLSQQKPTNNPTVNPNKSSSTSSSSSIGGEGTPPVLRTQILEVFNAETTILANQKEFEMICMTTRKSADEASFSLTKYHLYMESKNKYPISRKQAFSGFKLWLMNELKSTSPDQKQRVVV